MRDTKFGNNVLLNAFLHILVLDIGEKLYFDPLGEIIILDEELSSVTSYPWERTDYFQSSLPKRPGARERVKDPSWLMNVQGVPLALVTLLHKILSKILHARPPVLLSKGVMR